MAGSIDDEDEPLDHLLEALEDSDEEQLDFLIEALEDRDGVASQADNGVTLFVFNVVLDALDLSLLNIFQIFMQHPMKMTAQLRLDSDPTTASVKIEDTLFRQKSEGAQQEKVPILHSAAVDLSGLVVYFLPGRLGRGLRGSQQIFAVLGRTPLCGGGRAHLVVRGDVEKRWF